MYSPQETTPDPNPTEQHPAQNGTHDAHQQTMHSPKNQLTNQQKIDQNTQKAPNQH